MSDVMRLKKRLEEIKADIQSQEGRKAQLLDRLKEEHGCSSVDQASEKLKSMEEELKALEVKLESRVQSFKKKYKDLLDGEE